MLIPKIVSLLCVCRAPNDAKETSSETRGSDEAVPSCSLIFSFPSSRIFVAICHEEDQSTGYNFSIFGLLH